MNLQSMLAARIAADKPVRVGLIGAGKFGSMFLAQVPSIAGLDVAAISDLDPERAKAACRKPAPLPRESRDQAHIHVHACYEADIFRVESSEHAIGFDLTECPRHRLMSTTSTSGATDATKGRMRKWLQMAGFPPFLPASVF